MGLANVLEIGRQMSPLSPHQFHSNKAGVKLQRKRSLSGCLSYLGNVIGNEGKGKILEGLILKTGKTCLPSEDVTRIQRLIEPKFVEEKIHPPLKQCKVEEDPEIARKKAILEYLTSEVGKVQIKSESDNVRFQSPAMVQSPTSKKSPDHVEMEVEVESQCQSYFEQAMNNACTESLESFAQFALENQPKGVNELPELISVENATPLSELERMKSLLPEVKTDPSAAAINSPVSPASSVSSSSSRDSDDEAPSKKPLAPYNGTGQILLWQFIIECLATGEQGITWTNQSAFEFKFTQPDSIARAWGRRKNKSTMTYDKMSRSLRTYYKKKILRKVHDHRHVFQFYPNVEDVCKKALQSSA